MKTFNEETKQKYIRRAIKHRIADEIIQDSYWKKRNYMGCLAHTNKYDHEELEKQTGIPQWLSNIADSLYDGLPEGECQTWPERFIKSIPVNKDSEWFDTVVKPRFLIMVLESTLHDFDHEKFPKVKRAVDGAIALWKRDDIGSYEWEDDAFRAAYAADFAVESATGEAAKAAAAAAASEAANKNIYSDKLVDEANKVAKAAAYVSKVAKAAYYTAKAEKAASYAAAEATEKHGYFSKKLIEILSQ